MMPQTSHRTRPARLVPLVLFLLAACGTAVPVCAQDDTADARRLIEHLRIRPGMTVAEIGAGRGELTVAMGQAVGPEGRVFSNELDANRHPAIRRAVERAELTNVTVVEGRPAETNLPDACCDAIFMRDVYHHFGDPAPMNASLWRSLKPGGRIAILDFPPRGGSNAAGPDGRARGSGHGVLPETVAQELTDAGFVVEATEHNTGQRWFLVVAARP